MSAKHRSIDPFPCEVCGLVLADYEGLQEHILKHHKPQKVNCHYCENTVEDNEALQNHMIEMHPDVVIVHTMAKQVDQLTDDSASFDA